MINLILETFLIEHYVLGNFVIAFILICLICLTMLNKKTLVYLKEFKTLNVKIETLKSVVANFIFSVILTTVFAFAIGYRFTIPVSGSMSPSIQPGDVLVIKKIPFEKLEINDVITYQEVGASIPTTHQIIAIRKDGVGFQLGEKITYSCKGEEYTFEISEGNVGKTIITHGIANDINSIDSAITYKEVKGKVFYDIRYVGFIVHIARTQMVAFIFFAINLFMIYYCYFKYPTYKFE